MFLFSKIYLKIFFDEPRKETNWYHEVEQNEQFLNNHCVITEKKTCWLILWRLQKTFSTIRLNCSVFNSLEKEFLRKLIYHFSFYLCLYSVLLYYFFSNLLSGNGQFFIIWERVMYFDDCRFYFVFIHFSLKIVFSDFFLSSKYIIINQYSVNVHLYIE